LKSGSLNLLEPSGPVQACNGIDSPFKIYVSKLKIYGVCEYSHVWGDWPQLEIVADSYLGFFFNCKYWVRHIILVFKSNPRYWQDIRNLHGWVHMDFFLMTKEIN
jgi:hypothetical protein